MKDKINFRDAVFLVVMFIVAAALVFIKVTSQSIDGKEEKNNVKSIVAVHIKGEVQKSGYYELEYGSRVKDAIEKAGGSSKNADLDKVNLAKILTDGEEIIIPSKSKQKEEDDGKISINNADKENLCTIDGIGQAIAERIIGYREENGGFKNIDELKKIEGIGSSKFKKMADKVKL